MKKFGVTSVLLASALFSLTPLTSFATTPTAPAQPSSAAAVKPAGQMDEKIVLSMAIQAKKIFWQVQSAKTTTKAFVFKEIPYVYLNDAFSTKEKIVAAFEQVYTKEASSFYFDQAGFELYQNKVAVVDGDFGSLLDWEKAKVSLSFERPSTKTYLFTVPLGDTGESQEAYVTVKLVPNAGWKIINSPGDIR
ncbi:MAG: DL-endopeptidase inhibitor IseA family protein [Clostridia bacterium]